jgi:uroporphyrinogen-III synthase
MASVVVTRPASQGGPLARALARAGHRVHLQPLLELESLGEPDSAARRILQDLDLFQHIIFVSGNAVRFGFDWIDGYWPQPPAGLNWYAVGDATAALLAERGLAPVTPGREMTSEGLLALPALADPEGERVLLVKGEGGRNRLRDELTGRGATVQELACYRRRCPQLPAGELARRLRDWEADTLLLSSGDGLANLLQLLSREETSNVADIRLLVPSARVARQAQDAGFSRVITADNASDAAMLRALEQRPLATENSE